MRSIALVTARVAVAVDDDLAPLAAALEAGGARASIVPWDEPETDWGRFDAAVLRSAWDYPQRIDEFLRWVETVDPATELMNSAATVRWNGDKRYLADLARAGVPVVPTLFVGPSEPVKLPPGDQVVVKPAVSAGSRDTGRFDRDDPAAMALAARILGSGRTAMIQPYQHSVDGRGERALVWFDGDHSHAFRKGPLLRTGAKPEAGLFAPEEITPAVADATEVEIARLAIAAATAQTGEVPVYARVDLVEGDDGTPIVLELELIEPSVYHWCDPRSATRFVEAILSRLP